MIVLYFLIILIWTINHACLNLHPSPLCVTLIILFLTRILFALIFSWKNKFYDLDYLNLSCHYTIHIYPVFWVYLFENCKIAHFSLLMLTPIVILAHLIKSIVNSQFMNKPNVLYDSNILGIENLPRHCSISIDVGLSDSCSPTVAGVPSFFSSPLSKPLPVTALKPSDCPDLPSPEDFFSPLPHESLTVVNLPSI